MIKAGHLPVCFDDLNSDNYPELKNDVIMMMIDCCARDPYDRPRFIDLKRSLLDPFLPNSPRTNRKISTITSPISVNPPTPSMGKKTYADGAMYEGEFVEGDRCY